MTHTLGTADMVMPECLDGRKLCRKDSKALVQEICRGILQHYSAATSAADLVSLVARPYLKRNGQA